jgi:hypothetical protein
MGAAYLGTRFKERPWRSESYRRLVAAFPCEHCSRPGPSQAAHADFGKGMALKADDRTCYAACPRCHEGIGTLGWFRREHRRHLEVRYGSRTVWRLQQLGRWPAGLAVPEWFDPALGAHEITPEQRMVA